MDPRWYWLTLLTWIRYATLAKSRTKFLGPPFCLLYSTFGWKLVGDRWQWNFLNWIFPVNGKKLRYLTLSWPLPVKKEPSPQDLHRRSVAMAGFMGGSLMFQVPHTFLFPFNSGLQDFNLSNQILKHKVSRSGDLWWNWCSLKLAHPTSHIGHRNYWPQGRERFSVVSVCWEPGGWVTHCSLADHAGPHLAGGPSEYWTFDLSHLGQCPPLWASKHVSMWDICVMVIETVFDVLNVAQGAIFWTRWSVSKSSLRIWVFHQHTR